MSFKSKFTQEYPYDGANQYMQQIGQVNRQISGSSGGSGVSCGAEGNSTQLYMGDLNPSWTENDIRQIWANLGEPNVQVKLMKNNYNNGNSGYCFIEFPSKFAASNALLKTGLSTPLDPKRSLKLNWASFASIPGTEFSTFVGDLAPNVTESQLFGLFISQYSSTLNAKIVLDQVTGVSKGYGFVKFGNESEQQRSLLEMQGVFLNGRAIRVSTTSKNKSRFQGTNAGGSNPVTATAFNGAGTPTGSAQSNSTQNLLQHSQFIYPVQQQPALSQFTDLNNTTVFIGGLSSLVTEDELRAYFQPFGQIVYVKIPVGKGCGFVQYVDRGAAENAIAKMQGFPIGNSRIRLSWGRSAKQAAAMQQAFAMTLKQQSSQQESSLSHTSNSHNSRQQSHQQQQSQHQSQGSGLQQQSLLQQQLQQQFPYQGQPTMPPTYSYTFDTLTGTGSNYVPIHNILHSQLSSFQVTTIPDGSSSIPLQGRPSADYTGFSSASNNLSFNFSPSSSSNGATYNQALDYTSGIHGSSITPTSSTLTSARSPSHPHILLQSSESYLKSRNLSLERLEQGSNGYVFV